MPCRALRPFLPVLLLTGLITTARAQTAPTTVTFSSQTYNTGPAPIGVVSGDFNEDGKPDLAIIDGASNFVIILRNDGNGQFSLGSQTNTGNEPVQIVTGTFNLTGHQDLAVANAGDRTITILLGRGDGSFSTESFPLNGVPMAMAAGDFLNDGLTQLAVVECAGRATAPCSLNIYQSNSRALFSRSQSIPLPGAPQANGIIASDDFAHQHKPGLAVGTDNRVLIFANTSSFNGVGAATFALHSTITPPGAQAVASLAAGHFTPNPTPDLAIEAFTNLNDTNFPTTDYIYLNQGAGAFFLKSTVPGNRGFGRLLAVSDINGDGIQDLLLLSTTLKIGDLEYALGRGDGTFASPQEVSGFPGGNNTWITTRDLNLDSRQDLAVTSTGSPLAGAPAFTAVLLNQNALTNCPPPGSATLAVKFCSVTESAGLISVRAGGNSPNGVKRMELWIDGSKRAQSFSDQLRASVSVSAGKHQVTVVGVDLYDALVKNTVTANVP